MTMQRYSNALRHAKQLISRPSVTPEHGGTLEYLAQRLTRLGFECHRIDFAASPAPSYNLFAERPSEFTEEDTTELKEASVGGLGFSGHVDVVPPGNSSLWASDPFSAQVRGDRLYGRGAEDMKGAIASYIAALEALIDDSDSTPNEQPCPNPKLGTSSQPNVRLPRLVFMATSDEEGPATNGTTKIMDWAAAKGKLPSHCVIGEPASRGELGDQIKVGRRGSLNCTLSVYGKQGHAAYPSLARNPVTALAKIVNAIDSHKFQDADEDFDATEVSFTTFDTGNTAANVIPARASARFTTRFTPHQSFAELIALFETIAREIANRQEVDCEFVWNESAIPFININASFWNVVSTAVTQVTGKTPERSTAGGTSDGRFIYKHCPVVEIGHVGNTLHQANECVALPDLDALALIYERIIQNYATTFR